MGFSKGDTFSHLAPNQTPNHCRLIILQVEPTSVQHNVDLMRVDPEHAEETIMHHFIWHDGCSSVCYDATQQPHSWKTSLFVII